MSEKKAKPATFKHPKPNTKTTAAATEYLFSNNPSDIACNTSGDKTVLKVKILGTPRPMYRVQAVSRKTGKLNVFTPSRANKISFQNAVRDALKETGHENPFSPGSGNPVSITANFYLRRPNSHFDMNGLNPRAPLYCTKNPDIDNLLKLIMDALQGLAYDNDNVVCEVVARKYWLHKDAGHPWKDHFDREECTIIKVTEHRKNTIEFHEWI